MCCLLYRFLAEQGGQGGLERRHPVQGSCKSWQVSSHTSCCRHLKVSQTVCCEGSCGGNAAACKKQCPGWGCCHRVPTVPTLSCAVSGASAATLPVCSPQCPAQGVADRGHSRNTGAVCCPSSSTSAIKIPLGRLAAATPSLAWPSRQPSDHLSQVELSSSNQIVEHNGRRLPLHS